MTAELVEALFVEDDEVVVVVLLIFVIVTMQYD